MSLSQTQPDEQRGRDQRRSCYSGGAFATTKIDLLFIALLRLLEFISSFFPKL